MPATYDSIASTTLGSAQSSVTFSTISGSFTDIVAVCNIKGDAGNIGCEVQLNSDTGSNYSNTQLQGNGTTAASFRYSNQTSIFITSNYGAGTNEWATVLWNFQNYSNTTTNKTVLGRYSRATHEITAGVGLWRSTNAITTIKFTATGGSFITGSTFTLYGIKAA